MKTNDDKVKYYRKSFIRLREHGWSYRAIAKMYAVSHTAVRCACLGIPTKKAKPKAVAKEVVSDDVPTWWKGTRADYLKYRRNTFGD